MPRKTSDWSYLPACPTCTAEAGEQCLDVRPLPEGEPVRTIDYPHTDRRPRNRGAGSRTPNGHPYPERPGDRTKAVKAHLDGLGIDGPVKVKSASGTETTVAFGDLDPKGIRAALKGLKWAGMQLDLTPTTVVITQK